jgi:hypothetical protein
MEIRHIARELKVSFLIRCVTLLPSPLRPKSERLTFMCVLILVRESRLVLKADHADLG